MFVFLQQHFAIRSLQNNIKKIQFLYAKKYDMFFISYVFINLIYSLSSSNLYYNMYQYLLHY